MTCNKVIITDRKTRAAPSWKVESQRITNYPFFGIINNVQGHSPSGLNIGAPPPPIAWGAAFIIILEQLF
jgi:hypothetical protein